MGTFVSTLTQNQIVAGILSFCLFLGMWTLGWADDPMAGPGAKVVAYLGVTTHLEDLVKGVVDLKDVVFYLSVDRLRPLPRPPVGGEPALEGVRP